MESKALRLQYQDLGRFIFVDKVSGLNTHSPDLGKFGLCEILEKEIGQDLFVVHRLDKGTSGVLIFAKDREFAAKLSQCFEQHQVEKVYYFLTDQKHTQTQFEVGSRIFKDRGEFHNDPYSPEKNSWTHFEWQKTLGKHELWLAKPKSGKPHQIRLHAQQSGIAILGDQDHGGTPAPRLFLHSQSLKIPLLDIEISTAMPSWAEEELRPFKALEVGPAKRQHLYNYRNQPEESLRLVHQEADSYRIDKYGSTLWVYWYQDAPPSADTLKQFEQLAISENCDMWIRQMLNRGEDPNAGDLWKIGSPPERWTACENGIKFELRSDTGMSPGLFLDQRENRWWLKQQVEERSVLNLFSYTCGFSLYAALGGASEVVSVDASQNFLDWGKRNFEINGLDPEKYEFWAADALFFLKGCQRRRRRFSFIICDPPSFGRTKNGIFSIGKNWEELVLNCLACMGSGGILLFSTNYEKWTLDEMKKNFNRLRSQSSFKILDAPPQGLDFEFPSDNPLMKTLIIRKN